MPDLRTRFKEIDREYKRTLRENRRDFMRAGIILGLVIAILVAVFVAAYKHDTRVASECEARTCPGSQTAALLDGYCICVTEPSP